MVESFFSFVTSTRFASLFAFANVCYIAMVLFMDEDEQARKMQQDVAAANSVSSVLVSQALHHDRSVADNPTSSLSVLTWNVLSIGLRSNFFDVDPPVYVETRREIEKTEKELDALLGNAADASPEAARGSTERLRRLLAKSLAKQQAGKTKHGRDLLRAEFLFYAFFRSNVKRIFGDHRIFLSPTSGTPASLPVNSQTIGELLRTKIEQPAYLEGVFPLHDYFLPAVPSDPLSWADCLGGTKASGAGGRDPVFGDRPNKALNVENKVEVSAQDNLLPNETEERWQRWEKLLPHEWLIEDREIYGNPKTKKFSLSQGAKFLPKRGLNAWSYTHEARTLEENAGDEHQKNVGGLVLSDATSSAESRLRLQALTALVEQAGDNIDYLKMRVYDLLLLKCWHDAAITTDSVRLNMYLADQDDAVEDFRSQEEGRVLKKPRPNHATSENEAETDESPLPLQTVWDSLKSAAGDYQVDAKTHLKHVFEVVVAKLHGPDVVLLQEVDKSCLHDRALLCEVGAFPILSGEEDEVAGLLEAMKSDADAFAKSGGETMGARLQKLCEQVVRSSGSSSSSKKLAENFPYLAFFGSTGTKDPDNSVILVRTDLVRRVNSITSVTPRILRVNLDLALVDGSAGASASTGDDSKTRVSTVELGSYHFSSGHAATTREFEDNIFSIGQKVGEVEGSAPGTTSRPRLLLGGDLNTEPEKIAAQASTSKASSNPATAAASENYNKNALVRLTETSSAGGNFVTYAKKLSLLQPQFTKAEKVEKQNIDHVYGLGFEVIADGIAYASGVDETIVRMAYESAADGVGYRDAARIGGKTSDGGRKGDAGRDSSAAASGRILGLLPADEDFYLPISGHPFFRSDHMPVYFRVRAV
eukprot:g3426.t1